jgi:cytochrome c biogenesis protein CcmG/thiol:disulfide interchange protein DsbE
VPREANAGAGQVSQTTRAVGTWLVALTAVAIVVTLATVEFRTRGTGDIGGFTVANYKARAEVESTPAPEFSLPSLDGGERVGVSSFRGHVVVLNFWASWCFPCRTEAPGLRWVSEHYRAQGVRFLGVDERDDQAAARAFVEEFGWRYPIASDPAGSLAYGYRLIGLPTTFIIDPSGTIRYRFQGYLDRDVLRSALDDVLSGSDG